MASVYLGLGSNIEPRRNLRLGVDALRDHFGELRISPVYRSKAVGFEGDDFLNLVVGLDTDIGPAAVQDVIEEIHDLAGRERGAARFAARTLDIDLLLYADLVRAQPDLQLPRADILEYDFVLRPLADLAPDLLHPATGRSMAEHWREFAGSDSALALAADID